MKRCTSCKKLKSLTSFNLNPTQKDGKDNRCRKCIKEYHSSRYKKNTKRYSGKPKKCNLCHKTFPRRKKYWRPSNSGKDGLNVRCAFCDRMMYSYGISLLDYEKLVEAQKGLCAICQTNPGTNLHIDHDHAIYDRKRDGMATVEIRRSSVRGLLCAPCNRTLGWYEYLHPRSKDTWGLVENYIKNPPAQKIL